VSIEKSDSPQEVYEFKDMIEKYRSCKASPENSKV
jgi:hypothetical protein